MTVPVPDQLTYTYDEDGVTTVFPYLTQFLEPDELVVVREVDGEQTVLVYGIDYTVSGPGDPSGGAITRTSATNGGKIIITRKTKWRQDVDLEDSARNPAEAVEKQLDRFAIAGQDIAEELARAVKLPVGEDPSGLDELTADLRRVAKSADEIDTVAGSISDVEAVSSSIADVNALAPVAGDIAGVASIKDDVSSVAANLQAIDDIGDIATEIAALGAIPDAIVGVYDIASDVTTVASIKDDVQAVPGLVQDAQDARDDAVDAKNAAQAAAVAAAGSASSASTHASNAANSALASENAKTAAESARDAAIGAKSDAEAAASTAEDAASDAQGYASDAQGYASAAAGSASTAAGHASNAANAASAASDAKDDAEDARDAAILARGVAETARDEAVQAKEDAEAARDQANNIVGNLSGGLAGQFLVKNSNSDYDYGWANISGGGDMLSPVYDPTGVAADAFNMDNMVEGLTNKILTAAERAKIADVDGKVSKAGDTMAGKLVLAAPTESDASLHLPDGTSPTNPDNGDLWFNGTTLSLRANGISRSIYHTGNLPTVQQAEAEAGTGTSARAWTAERVNQAIQALSPVKSVNGKTGSIVLTNADVGAAAASHTHANATTSAAGFMSATDKQKLDGIAAGANVTNATTVGSAIHGSSAKATPVDADTVALIDSAASNTLKKLSWSNIKATLKFYFDTLYAAGDDSRITGALQRSGGTMTGALTLSGNPTSNLHAATKQYVDNAVASVPTSPVGLYTGSSADETNFPVGHMVLMRNSSDNINRNASNAVRIPATGTTGYSVSGTGSALSGTWRSRGTTGDTNLMQRTA